MKKKLLLPVILLFCFPLYSQVIIPADVPENIINGFKNKYPDITVDQWEIIDRDYVATAKFNRLQGNAVFTPIGTWVKTFYPIKERELPSTILAYRDNNYSGYKISFSEFTEGIEGEDYYLVSVVPGKTENEKPTRLYFSLTGDFIKSISPEGIIKRPETETVEEETDVVTSEEETSGRILKWFRREGSGEEEIKSGISESDVPDIVIKYQSRKFPRSEDITWDSAGGLFIASFIFRDTETKAQFDSNGVLLQTTTIMDRKTLYQLVLNYLDKTHSPYKILHAEKNVRKDRNNNYYVRISKKVAGHRQPLIFDCYFDKSGRIIREEEPDELYEDEPLEEYNPTEDKFVERIDEDYTKLPEEDQYDHEVDPKTLPSPATKYINKNYPIIYKITEAYYELNEELGRIYHVYIQKEGLNQTASELFFDLNGNLLKKLEEGKEEESFEAEEPLTRKEISAPDTVVMNFNKKYPMAEDVSWEKEYGEYIAVFEMDGSKARAKYTSDGEWISSTVTIDHKNLYSPISRYIEKEYRGYTATRAEKTTRKDRKDYYCIEIYNRKKSPPSQEIYFNKAGKFMEEPPE